MAPDQRRPPVWLFRALSPLVRALVRSPLLDRRLMLFNAGERFGLAESLTL